MVIPSIPSKPDIPKLEREILSFWNENDIFKKVQDLNKDNKPFVFLEGPPTANGHPHIGHALTRAIKDVYLRYHTMNGYYVTPRIGGWDTHGLPVEIEVEKELGLESKEDIEAYGIDKFNAKCRESVFRYVKEWEEMSERIGFHLDMPKSYITMSENYVETVWWSLKEIYKKKLLFKGFKVVPYCPRCGTSLSSHEVAQGYREVDDPSIYIKFKIKGEQNRFFLAWTTTPWTLLSNLVLAVSEDDTYIEVEENGEKLVFAKELLSKVFPDGKDIIAEYKGKEFVDTEYEALFSYTHEQTSGKRHFVAAADFVSMEEGTGIVHCAPAFGLEDAELCQEIGVAIFNPVDLTGKFLSDMPLFGGQFVKDADPSIIKHLIGENKLLKVSKITHTYPFCWRCDSPLLYYAIESWFIGMSQVRKKIQELNQNIRWQPQHLKDGRFGNFLDELKDWALSRSRYWGTPIPIWTCEKGHEFCVGSRQELEQLSGKKLPKNFSLHKPFVDEIQLSCPECKSKATREPYVIDCWYDSGAATLAQWHYPFENKEEFDKHFPIDFITEAIDQTRGWFYSLLAISTLVFEKEAYKTCLTMGHVLDEDGKKMSKSKGNAIDPKEAFEKYGADPVRWLLFSSPTWNNLRFGYTLIEESIKDFILPLWNVLYFFITYANLDNFDPNDKKYKVKVQQKPLIDKWLISRYNNTIKDVREAYDDLSIQNAVKALRSFVVNDLSNLWIRQSRRRFWEKELSISKKSAYSTLYETIESLIRLISPFTPFLSEFFYQTMVKSQGNGKLSVYMEKYPAVKKTLIKADIEKNIEIARDSIATGRAIRAKKDYKSRWPLKEAIFVVNKEGKKAIKVMEEHIKAELNIKSIVFADDPLEFQDISLVPNFKELGPIFKKQANKIANWIRSQDESSAKEIAGKIKDLGKVTVSINGEDVELTDNFLSLRIVEKEGYAGGTFGEGNIFLNLTQDDELIREGFVRDIIRRVQSMRKDMELVYDAQVTLSLVLEKETKKMIQGYEDLIKEEVLSKEITFSKLKSGFSQDWEIVDPTGTIHNVYISLKE